MKTRRAGFYDAYMFICFTNFELVITAPEILIQAFVIFFIAHGYLLWLSGSGGSIEATSYY